METRDRADPENTGVKPYGWARIRAGGWLKSADLAVLLRSSFCWWFMLKGRLGDVRTVIRDYNRTALLSAVGLVIVSYLLLYGCYDLLDGFIAAISWRSDRCWSFVQLCL